MDNITFSTWDSNDYITFITKESIKVYCNDITNIFFEYITDTSKVNGSIFFNGVLNYTKSDETIIYQVDLCNMCIEIDIKEKYEYIRIIKCLANSDRPLYVLRVIDQGKRYGRTIFYDIKENKEVLELPMVSYSLFDVEMIEKDIVIQITDYKKNVSLYEDDNDEMEYRIIKYNMNTIRNAMDNKGIVESKDLMDYTGVYVYETWEGIETAQELRYSRNLSGDWLHFPLFDYWGYNWPEEKSISAYGSAFLEWTDDYKGICIASTKNSDVMYYFEAPFGGTKKSKYYFNEKKKVIYIIDNNKIWIYKLNQNNELIIMVNDQYNKAHIAGKALQKFSEFDSLFNKCLYSAELKLINEIEVEI